MIPGAKVTLLGPGLLERSSQRCMVWPLSQQNLRAVFFKVGVLYLKHWGSLANAIGSQILAQIFRLRHSGGEFLQAHSDKSAHENLRILS